MIDNFSLSDPATKPAAALMAEEHWWINVDSTSPPGVPDPLLSVVRAAGKRQQHIVKALAKENLTFGSKNAYSGVMDAFHGEMPFGMAPSAKRAVLDATHAILEERQDEFVEPDGMPYSKGQPRILQQLAADHLFRRFHRPTPGVPGVRVKPSEVVLYPYTSTLLLEKALLSVAIPGGVIVSPGAFYKSNASLAVSAGLRIRTFPTDVAKSGAIDPEHLSNAIAYYKRKGTFAAVLFTMPGNPLIAEYTLEELERIGRVILEHEVPVIVDTLFDRMIPDGRYIPLAAINVTWRGRSHRLYDHIVSISGNSKGYNAPGPYKIGAIATGNETWRMRILDLIGGLSFLIRHVSHRCS